MTVRHIFAAIALHEFIKGHRHDEDHSDAVVEAAYAWADKMVAAGKVRKGKVQR